MMEAEQDSKELLGLFKVCKVKLGGYALAFHGRRLQRQIALKVITQFRETAFFAERFSGFANVPSMKYNKVRNINPLFFRDNFH